MVVGAPDGQDLGAYNVGVCRVKMQMSCGLVTKGCLLNCLAKSTNTRVLVQIHTYSVYGIYTHIWHTHN